MKIGFILAERYWQRKGIGSSRIRGRWVIEHLNNLNNLKNLKNLKKKQVEVEEFIQGKNYDVVVYQKAYWKEHARAFKGIKVLDICDPDWLEGAEVASFANEMDLITVPTDKMKESLEKFTKKPIHILPDSVNFDVLPKPKEHTGRAKSVVWFGYSGNADVLYPTLPLLKEKGLKLIVVSDGHFNSRQCEVENVKWEEETCDLEYQKADFALLPEKKTERFSFKSNNKTIHALALGLPVAKTPKDVERFIYPEERKKELREKQEFLKEYSTVCIANKFYDILKVHK